MGITEEEFKSYLKVQEGGMFNMFDPRARMMTGLSKEKYLEIIKNYNALEKKYGGLK